MTALHLKNRPFAALTCAALLGYAAAAQAGVIIQDHFDYANGGLGGRGGGIGFGINVWFHSNSSVSDGVAVGGGHSSAKRNFATSLGTTGTVWVRFDWGNSEAPAANHSYGGLTFYNGTSDGGTESFLIGNPWTSAPASAQWNISSGSGSPNTATPNHPSMKSGVAKLDLSAGTVRLWVGAPGTTMDVSETPDAEVSGLNLANIQGIRINGFSGNSASQSFDNLTIGSAMADVDAIDGPPLPPNSGAWSNTDGGQWGAAANWSNDTVAIGSGNTADFSMLNLTADAAITLDSERTIGHLIFGDTDAASPAGWTLTNQMNSGDALILSGPTPTITVSALGGTKNATINAAIGGSEGLTKTGTGILALAGAISYSGETTVSEGTLLISRQRYLNIGRTTNVASGAVLELNDSDNTFTTLMPASTVTGGGTFRLSGNSTINQAANGTTGTRLTMAMQPGGWIDLQGTSRLTSGGWQLIDWTQNKASMHIGSGATFDLWDGRDVFVDALTGAGQVVGGNSARGLHFGINDGTGTFSGSISISASLIKQGSGTQIFTGENGHTGTTTIHAGTLQIGDGGPSGTLGTGPVSGASGATLAFNRSDHYVLPATQIISGAGGLRMQGTGTLTISGRNVYSGTTAVQSGVLALANSGTLGEGVLSISSGAKVALDFTGQTYVTQLTLGGVVQAAGTYGSSSSPATNRNDTYFSGTGVIQISANVDHAALATSQLQAANAAWVSGDWGTVRSALSGVFNNLRLDAPWRSIAHLRYARSFQATGNYATASTIFGNIAAITEYPRIHQIEGAECKIECDRLTLGLPGRDPEASKVRVTAAPQPGRTLHVAPHGDAANPGTLAQPFATVNQALAANRAAGPVAGGASIVLAAGRYPLANTIALTRADSGAGADAPLSIRASTPGTAVISGSKRLSGFTVVTDGSVLARLPAEAQGKVMQCSLADLGITDYGSIQEHPVVNLSVNGVPQTLARWPNSGFVRIGGMVDRGNIDRENPSLNRPQIFNYSGTRPTRWTTATDAWIQGYLATNWFYGSVAIGSINPQAGTITTASTYTRLSGWPDINSGSPYSVLNLLEEIDEPGEWYLDRTTGMLYWYPAVDPSTAVVDFSVFSGSMLTVTDASHVRIEGLVFESSRGSAVELLNASHSLIAGCTIRNVSGVAVRINGGFQNSMIGCDLHDLEHMACHIDGGNGDTLTPGNHLVANCRFRNFGRTSRSTGLSLNGVGHRIAHCVFEDGPSSAIAFSGFNFLVEYNEFRNACNETDDFGVIYAWGNPTWRGNIWRFNQFSHCGGGYTQGWLQNRYFGVSGFRFDDAVSGQTVYGNVFNHFDAWGTAASVMGNNSGRDNIYDNNLVTDSRGVNYGYYDGGNHRYRGGLPNGISPANLAAFPELANVFDGNGQNYIWRSTALRVTGGLTSYAERAWGGWQFLANTNTGTDPGFVEGVELKEFIDPTRFWDLGMRAIPVDEIGLYQDSTRDGWIANPNMAYWNESSGSWNATTPNWATAETAPAGIAWKDHGHTTAVFTGTGGTVTTAAPLSVGGLIFTAPGHTLAGSHPLSINAPLTVIDTKNFDATISAPLIGLGGISVAGAGTLTLSGANRYTGTTTVENGTLSLSGGENRLPPGTVVTLGGGGPAAVSTLKLNGCSQELAGLWTADFDSGVGAGNRVVNGSATPGTLTLNIEHSRNNQFEGTLGGSGEHENNFAVRKIGGGGLWLNRSITWSGGTTIEEGTLELNSSWYQNNQAYGTFRIGKGATFAVSGRVSALFFKGVTVEFLPAGGGNLIQRASPDWLDWRSEWGLTIRSTGGERNLFQSAANDYINLIDGANFDVARGSDPTTDLLVSLPLVGNGSITKQGNGIMTLSGSNSYSGTTVIAGGILNATTFSNYGAASSLGNRASDSGSGNVGILFRGGTLQYTGTTPQSTNRAIRISTDGGATIDASGSNPNASLSFTAASSPDFLETYGDRTLTLTGSNTGDNTFAMAITEAGTTSLVKSGSGKWILTGANLYTGSTTVSNGVLALTSATLGDESSVVIDAGAMLQLDFIGTDQINALKVDGHDLPPGIYSSASGFITGPGTLTVTSGPAFATYASWSSRGIHNLTGGPTADDDNDGIANLLEYVLGGDPRIESNQILPTASTSGGNLVFTFRRMSSTTTDTTQVFQHSTNLTDWTDVPLVPSSTVVIHSNTPQDGTETVIITLPSGTSTQCFARLKISR
jgi:autotransporter-associated beta strand protein